MRAARAASQSRRRRPKATASLIIVINEAGAKVYGIDRSLDGGHRLTADDASRLLHVLWNTRPPHDGDGADPADDRFFEQVAGAASAAGEIVIIGRGNGQSDDAEHLSAYLKAHHETIHARIARVLVADLPRLTTPETLELGCHAFAGSRAPSPRLS